MDYDLQNQELTITDSGRQCPREENGEGEPQSGEGNSEVQTYKSDQHRSQQSNASAHAVKIESKECMHGANSHPLREELPTKLLVRKASEH